MADFKILPPAPASQFTILPPAAKPQPGGFSIVPPPSPGGLVPAIQKPDGSLVVGAPGDKHNDLPTVTDADRRGFTVMQPGSSNHAGFLSRQQGAAIGKAAGAAFLPDNLHTEDLNKARDGGILAGSPLLKGYKTGGIKGAAEAFWNTINPFSAQNEAHQADLMDRYSKYSKEFGPAFEAARNGDPSKMKALREKYGDPSGEIAMQLGMGASSPLKDVPTAVTGAVGKVAVSPAGRTVERILSPTTVDAPAGRAESVVRQGLGAANRATSQTVERAEPFARTVERYMPEFTAWSRLTPQQRTNHPLPQLMQFYNYVEGRSTGAARPTDPALGDFADTVRQEMQLRQQHYQAIPRTMNAGVIEDYFAHMWEQSPQQVTQALNRRAGTPLQGSGRNLQSRTIPTIADGLAAGLTLRDANPVTAMQTYVNNMDRYLAWDDITQAARDQGDAKYFTVGSRNIPDGWVPLKGRLSQRQTPAGPMQLYAPEGFATVYNNAISRGFQDAREFPNVSKVFDATRKTANSVTALKLGLSGFHGISMMVGSVASDFAAAIDQAARGDFMGAIKTAAKAPAAPVTNFIRGTKIRAEYLGTGVHGMQREADLMGAANMRVDGRDPSMYSTNPRGSFVSSYRRGSLGREVREAFLDQAGKMTKTSAAKGAANMVGRTMDTIMAPLFDTYIPRIKAGVFQRDMSAWLEAHPNATREEQVAQARNISDSMDNRFGEMVQDNLFWNKMGKQVAQTVLLSPGWSIGTIRELGGGALDMARGDWTKRASYAVALPMTVGITSSIAQYLMTGKAPDAQTLKGAPLTGGMVQGTPERMLLPSEWKDIIGYTHDPIGEVANKANPALSAASELIQNKDWRGLPIGDPTKPALDPSNIEDYGKKLLEDISPISVGQLAQGSKKGSAIGPAATMFGIREAPAYLEDPEKAKAI